MIEQTAGNCVAMVVILCGLFLATAAYRLDRPAEITQMLNDMFWFSFVLPMPFFQVQSFAITWAVIVDTRPKPYFPKYLAAPNILMILVGFPTLATHVVYDGPLAWNGGFVFWTVTVVFFIQQVIEWRSIWLAISSEPEAGEAE